jgi:hypothetical protein
MSEAKHTRGQCRVDGRLVFIGETIIARCSEPHPQRYETPQHWTQEANATRLALCWNAHDALLAALHQLEADCQCTIDQYEKNGPTWTSRESGAEYYSASYVIDSTNEKLEIIRAAIAAATPAESEEQTK